MSKPLVVVGAGGFGREVLDVIEAINAEADAPVWTVLGVVDDRPSDLNLKRLAARGIQYLGTIAEVVSRSPKSYVVGVGSPAVRERIAGVFDGAGWSAATVVHPASTIGSQVTIGPGTVVCAGARVATNAELGSHAHLNANAAVGHDTRLGSCVSVNPLAAISGDCVVGDRALIGAGSVIRNGQRVGDDVVVGASACVVSDVPAGRTVVGVPAQ